MCIFILILHLFRRTGDDFFHGLYKGTRHKASLSTQANQTNVKNETCRDFDFSYFQSHRVRTSKLRTVPLKLYNITIIHFDIFYQINKVIKLCFLL